MDPDWKYPYLERAQSKRVTKDSAEISVHHNADSAHQAVVERPSGMIAPSACYEHFCSVASNRPWLNKRVRGQYKHHSKYMGI